jgi:hypothetical protein
VVPVGFAEKRITGGYNRTQSSRVILPQFKPNHCPVTICDIFHEDSGSRYKYSLYMRSHFMRNRNSEE